MFLPASQFPNVKPQCQKQQKKCFDLSQVKFIQSFLATIRSTASRSSCTDFPFKHFFSSAESANARQPTCHASFSVSNIGRLLTAHSVSIEPLIWITCWNSPFACGTKLRALAMAEPADISYNRWYICNSRMLWRFRRAAKVVQSQVIQILHDMDKT